MCLRQAALFKSELLIYTEHQAVRVRNQSLKFYNSQSACFRGGGKKKSNLLAAVFLQNFGEEI